MKLPQINLKPLFNNSGQGLVEIIAAIGIGTLLILALVSLSTRATRNSDISKTASEASRIASEGQEVLRNLRESNAAVFRYGAGTCSGNATANITWIELFSTINVADTTACGLGRVGYFVPSGAPNCSAAGIDNCLFFSDDVSSNEVVLRDGRTYTRRVYVADTPIADSGVSRCNQSVIPADFDRIKQFSVEVTWTDVGGPHRIVATNCFSL